VHLSFRLLQFLPVQRCRTRPLCRPPGLRTTGEKAAASASTAPNADGSCPASAPVKVSKSRIYHLPQGDGSYRRTHAQSCYSTPEAAQAAGFWAPR